MVKKLSALYDRYDAAVIAADAATGSPRYDAALAELAAARRELMEVVAAGVAKKSA